MSLDGIRSARVVTTPEGEVGEVHVLADAGLSPKQVARNVVSALLAQLGLRVDRRKVSVAQTACASVPVTERMRDTSLQRMVLFEGLTVAPSPRAYQVVLTVNLSYLGRLEATVDEVPDTPRRRIDGAARAAVAGIERLLGISGLVLDGVQVVEALDRQLVLVAVQGMGAREVTSLNGTAEIRESAERAAVLAVLNATNRWIEARGFVGEG